MLLMEQAGNSLFAQTPVYNTFSSSETDTVTPYRPIVVSPREVGMNPTVLSHIASIVKTGIDAHAFPGCQVLILKDGKTVYDRSFGHYTYESTQKVTPSTLYDLASLSKTTGTLLAIMNLYDEGKLRLTDKASEYLPLLRGTDKDSLTIADLLFHETGLPASLNGYCLITTKDTTNLVRMGRTNFRSDWISRTPSPDFPLQVSDSFYLPHRFRDSALVMIANMHLGNKTYRYSCINFLLLKEIAETISGKSMDFFLDSVYYTPMGLNDIAYLPLRKHSLENIAPTLQRDFLRNGTIQGYVHDPDAAFFGGVSGNAGLFATAREVAAVHQMLLNGGELGGKRYLRAETCQAFTTILSASGRRGLGFDKPIPTNPKHSPCCASAPKEVYGHTGYTGTCCWVDPVNRLIYVFLSNRTYPNDGMNKLARMNIRTKIQETIYQSMKK